MLKCLKEAVQKTRVSYWFKNLETKLHGNTHIT